MTLNNTSLPIVDVGTDNVAAMGAVVGTPTATSFSGQQLFDKLWMHVMQRTGALPTETMRMVYSVSPPFHHLLDPTTVASQFTMIYEILMNAVVAALTARSVCGFWNYITAGDGTTLMGIGFYVDSTDNLWHCFVRDSATGAAPITSLYDNATAVLSTAVHRMKIKIDGPTKTITWYIDGNLVGTYTPVAALRYVAPLGNVTGAILMHGAFVPANGSVIVRANAGTQPMVRLRVAGTPTIVPPVTSSTTIHVSIS